MIKKKFTIPLIQTALLSLLFTLTYAHVATTQTFNTYFSNGSSLRFQNDINKTLTLQITNGTFNNSNCILAIERNMGQFIFSAQENATVLLASDYSPISIVLDDVKLFPDDSFDTVTNQTYTLKWLFYNRSIIDDYFLVGVGLFGLGLCIMSPILIINIIKAGDWDKVDSIGLYFVLMLVGAGMMIIWLW